MNDIIADKILGCIIGGAIGDCLGAAAEGVQNPPLISQIDAAPWRITDDTQLTLATCEAIVERGTPDPEAIASSMLRWFLEGRLTGLGSGTLKALRDLDAGAHWALCGQRGERAAGNGAAMRIAPLVFCLDLSKIESKQTIRDVSRITHHHDEAYVGSLAIVMSLSAIINETWSFDWLISCLPDSTVRDRIVAYAALPVETPLATAAKSFGVSGYVAESVPFAIFAATRAEEIDFAQILKDVIGAGGDTDTNAAITGQLLGAKLGLQNLPRDYVQTISRIPSILTIAKQFATTVNRS